MSSSQPACSLSTRRGAKKLVIAGDTPGLHSPGTESAEGAYMLRSPLFLQLSYKDRRLVVWGSSSLGLAMAHLVRGRIAGSEVGCQNSEARTNPAKGLRNVTALYA